MQEGVVLGHFISPKGIEVDPTKIEVIRTLSIPTKLREVRSFLGHVGYYWCFIKDFSQIAAPLYKLLRKDAEFVWNDDSTKAFLQLKEVLLTTPVLQGPNWELPFHIYIDASNHAIGALLGQKLDSIEHAIYYINKNLQGAEYNYTVIEKELLAIIYALNKFRNYVTGYQIFVHTDHSPIKYLMKKPAISEQLARCLLLMQ